MIAVYAGSFDPFHEGHRSIIRRAARLFVHVRVLVAINPGKQQRVSVEARAERVREALRAFANVSVDATSGLVADHARSIGASVLVRGVRDADDAASEVALSWQNLAIAPELLTVWLPAEPGLETVSSTAIREKIGDSLAPATEGRS